MDQFTKHVNLSKKISLMRLLLLLTNLALLVAISLANKTGAILANGSVQTLAPAAISSPSSSSSLSSTVSSKDDIDDLNGDDGMKIKADMAEAEKKPNNTIDKHSFYEPEYILEDHERAMSFWVDFSKLSLSQANMSTRHEMLSKSHRRAAPIKLSFEFPFYGQPLRNIIIATGGFLYVGEHLHHWLAATQNISPLMANFDLSTSNFSDIHYHDNGTALVVQWQNVQMKDNEPPGNFSFQCTLHKNGDIVFVYASLPVTIDKIPDTEHPVKVGISDAFLIDRLAFFIRRKTIYDYHRFSAKDKNIGNRTAIYLKALPTCNQYDNCEMCYKSTTNDCVWCPAVKRCSSGFDRRRQEWLNAQCDKIDRTLAQCPAKGDGMSSSSSSASSSISTSGSRGSSSQSLSGQSTDEAAFASGLSGRQLMPNRITPESRAHEGGTAFVTFLMFMALTSGVALWTFYAYKNPHTPSGQLLIKYRPSNWRWQNAETRYTAASIHM